MADTKPEDQITTETPKEENSIGIDNSQLHHGYRENHTNPNNGRIETRVWYRPAGVEDEGRWLSAAEWDDVNRSPYSSEVLNEDGDRRYKLVKGVTAVQKTEGGPYTVKFEADDKEITIPADTFEASFKPVADTYSDV